MSREELLNHVRQMDLKEEIKTIWDEQVMAAVLAKEYGFNKATTRRAIWIVQKEQNQTIEPILYYNTPR